MRHIKNLIRLLSFFGLIVSASYSGAGEPTVQLSETINEFVQILASTPASELRTKGLPEKALTLVFNRFDFTEMAKRSLGRHWNALGASERREFVQAFTQKLLNAYGRTVRATGDEKVAYERETTDGKYSSVETRVSSSGGESGSGEPHAEGGQHRVPGEQVHAVGILIAREVGDEEGARENGVKEEQEDGLVRQQQRRLAAAELGLELVGRRQQRIDLVEREVLRLDVIASLQVRHDSLQKANQPLMTTDAHRSMRVWT